MHSPIDNALRAADLAAARGAFGTGLALVGGVGWLSTENIAWLLPVFGALCVAASNAFYSWKLAHAKAQLDLETYRLKLEKETGFDLPDSGI